MSDHVPPPLPGRSPGEAVSLLAHRVFGPLQRRPTRVVLDYHGLANRPAAVLTEIAGRHGVTTRTVSVNVARIRAAADLSLTPDTVEEAVRPSTPDEDHLGRTRVAATLHLPAPARAERPRPAPPPGGSGIEPGDRAAAVTVARLLAAVGPLPLDALVAAVARSRRFRRPAPSLTGLATALTALGVAAPGPDGLWRARPGTRAPAHYEVIVAAATGRDLTRHDMIDALIRAGYSLTSATGRMSSCHPLFQRIGPNRYRVIGSQDMTPQ